MSNGVESADGFAVVANEVKTSSGATDSQKAATELARMAAELQQLVGQLRY